jgi:hypothetical protein
MRASDKRMGDLDNCAFALDGKRQFLRFYGRPKVAPLIIMDSPQGRGKVMFPPELEREAFRTATGELGWTREHISLVVDVIRSHGMGILGGELWWIHGQPPLWDLHIPQLVGPPAIYVWAADRLPSESWLDYVERGAADALDHVEKWPNALELPPGFEGRIMCSLAWVSEEEYSKLRRKAV